MTYDADLCARLALEFAEDDVRATEAPWSFIYATVRKAIGDDDEYTVADMPRGERGDTETRQGGLDGEAIVRLRNNARLAAEQLRAAVYLIGRYEKGYVSNLAFGAIAAERERLAARLRAADELIKGILSWTKHGPHGSGEAGPCSVGCLKCRVAKYIAAQDGEQLALLTPQHKEIP